LDNTEIYLRVLLNFDGKDRSILGFTFPFDVICEVFVPIAFCFPVEERIDNINSTFIRDDIPLTPQD